MNTPSNPTDQAKRSALLDKISALLAKTRANGCTEAEALAAAKLAEKLMAKYGLSLSELESISSPSDACEADGAPIGKRRSHEVLRVARAIAHYTDTRYWYNTHGLIRVNKDQRRIHEHRGVLLVFFGLVADVQIAIYLTNVFRSAMDTEWKTYWSANHKKSDTPARTARVNFMAGMAERISQRLYSMKSAQDKMATNNCRAIVLAKERIVESAFDAAEIKIRTVSRRDSLSDFSAYAAGEIAADRVTIASGELPNE